MNISFKQVENFKTCRVTYNLKILVNKNFKINLNYLQKLNDYTSLLYKQINFLCIF